MAHGGQTHRTATNLCRLTWTTFLFIPVVINSRRRAALAAQQPRRQDIALARPRLPLRQLLHCHHPPAPPLPRAHCLRAPRLRSARRGAASTADSTPDADSPAAHNHARVHGRSHTDAKSALPQSAVPVQPSARLLAPSPHLRAARRLGWTPASRGLLLGVHVAAATAASHHHPPDPPLEVS